MISHRITKYVENNTAWAEAWIEITLFGHTWNLWRQRTPIWLPPEEFHKTCETWVEVEK
jgi:hypothetical protein